MTAITIDTSTLYDWLAKASGTVAIWASTRAHKSEVVEPDAEVRIQALTAKVRHPWKHRIERALQWMR